MSLELNRGYKNRELAEQSRVKAVAEVETTTKRVEDIVLETQATADSVVEKVLTREEVKMAREAVAGAVAALKRAHEALEVTRMSTDAKTVVKAAQEAKRALNEAEEALKIAKEAERRARAKIAEKEARRKAIKRKFRDVVFLEGLKRRARAKKAYAIKEEKKEQRRAEARAKREEEERLAKVAQLKKIREQKLTAATAEIEEINAMYDPNKVGKVEKRIEPKTIDGRKRTFETTILHTEHGPLIYEKSYINDYPQYYTTTIKGYAKIKVEGVEQIVFYDGSRKYGLRYINADHDTEDYTSYNNVFIKEDGEEIELLEDGNWHYFEDADNYVIEQLKVLSRNEDLIK